jgi:hypothetical protein
LNDLLYFIQGLLELSCNRALASQINNEVLSAVIDALKHGSKQVQLLALGSVWNLSVISNIRKKMLKVRQGGTGGSISQPYQLNIELL